MHETEFLKACITVYIVKKSWLSLHKNTGFDYNMKATKKN